ncbi:unnamed protein product [Diamesa tonsa]
MVLIEEINDNDQKEVVKEEVREPTADELKEQGNQCVKAGNYKEAILNYTFAIKLNKDDYFLYSNRSLAFLKQKQYYYALSDADRVIMMKPDFVKGYFRKADVLRETLQYDDALLNYGRALKLEPQNMTIINNLKQTAGLCNRETMLEARVPWIGAAIGIIIGITITLADQFTKKPSIKAPTLMVFLVIIIACVGFGISKLLRYYVKAQRKGMLEPPSVLLEDFREPEEEELEEEAPRRRPKYTKSQARQRYKKAKT